MNFIVSALSVSPPIASIGPAPPPTVLSVSPASGDVAGGTPVTITGSHFTGATSATIAGHAITGFTVVSDTQITGTTSAGVFGDVGVAKNVVVTNLVGPGTGVGLFTYTAWYQAFAIGGTFPTFFADFTTETTTDHYLFNGATQANFAAWLNAMGGTFTNATTTRYFINSSGLLATAAANVVRFDYDPVALTPKGLLLEGASTNNYLQSNNFATTWTLLAAGVTLSQNVTGPDGVASSGWTITAGAGGFASVFQTIANVVSSASSWDISFYAKKGTSSHAFICLGDQAGVNFAGTYFDINAGTVGTQNQAVAGAPNFSFSAAAIQKLPNGWYRVSVTVTQASGSTTLGAAEIGICDADASRACANGNGGQIYGAQYENLLFASSYIPTTTGTVTRSADSLTATPGVINLSASTLFGSYEQDNDSGTLDGTLGLYASGNINNNNLVITQNGGGTGGPKFVLTSGGANQFSSSPNMGGPLGSFRCAVAYGSGAFANAVNGGNSFTGIVSANPTGIDTLDLVAPNSSVNNPTLQQWVKSVGYWTITATAAQLQSLTT